MTKSSSICLAIKRKIKEDQKVIRLQHKCLKGNKKGRKNALGRKGLFNIVNKATKTSLSKSCRQIHMGRHEFLIMRLTNHSNPH